MRRLFRIVPLVVVTGLLCSCATSSMKETWKAPNYTGGPPKKIAVVAVEDRPMARPVFEGQFVSQLERRSQPALRTHEMMSLEEMKADKAATAERLQQAGADSILVVSKASSV